MVDASELGAIDEDPPFDWDGAKLLKDAFNSLASAIEDQRSLRMEAFATGLTSWQGAARDVYNANPRHEQGDTDAGEGATACRDAADNKLDALVRAALEEKDRRCEARDWKRRMEEHERQKEQQNALQDFGDWLFGDDAPVPPMPPPPRPEPHLSAPPGPPPDHRA